MFGGERFLDCFIDDHVLFFHMAPRLAGPER